MRIKVCGMTLPEQVNALDEMGVDFAGLSFIPGRQGISVIRYRRKDEENKGHHAKVVCLSTSRMKK
jgi:phosphoribosylanthranilate isomerase